MSTAGTDRRLRVVEVFNIAYARVLDDGDLADWPGFFTADARYVVTARENWERGLPAGLIYCEGRAMMADRAFAILNTAMYAPRYLRHFITNTWVGAEADDGAFEAGANYLLTQVLVDEPHARVHQVGRYIDSFIESDAGLRLRSRHCVYDDALIDNALILPV